MQLPLNAIQDGPGWNLYPAPKKIALSIVTALVSMAASLAYESASTSFVGTINGPSKYHTMLKVSWCRLASTVTSRAQALAQLSLP